MRKLALPAALIASVLALAGCGATSQDEGTPQPEQTSTVAGNTAPAADHGSADVEFATAMIPHHGQAIQMADQALERTKDPEIRQLAEDIKAAQGPEIEKMSGWLEQWDAPVPEPTMDMSDHGMDHSQHDGMAGMMSAEQMHELEQASGTKYDQLWVEMMIEHHQGAITMSKTEIDNGVNAEAKQLARSIIEAQRSEIAAMEQLLQEQS